MNKWLALLLAALLAQAFPAGAADGAPPPVSSYTFRDTPISELFDMLARTSRVNIVLAKGVTGNVSVSLYDLTVREAIEAIAEAGGYIVTARPGGFLISDPKTARTGGADTLAVASYKVRYTDAKKVGEILLRHVGAGGNVTVLEQSRSIVVEDTEANQRRIAAILRTIDAAPRQILIEAKILEITLDQSETFGVDWTRIFNGAGTEKVGTAGLATRNNLGLVLNVVNSNINVYLSALSNKGRVHTLATPKLLALEDQEAVTNVGDKLGYRLTTTINNVTSESIEFLETGVILRVTPSVDADGRIAMKIKPEVSSGSISTGIPSKKTTEVATQLVADDGQAVLIGGLIKSSKAYRRQGIPVLSDIPLLGRAFSGTDDGGTMTETVVVITPRIVPAGGAALDAATAARMRDSETVLNQRASVLDKKIDGIAPARTGENEPVR